MEEEISRIKTFLKEFNEQIQSPTSDDVSARIGSYSIDPEDVFGQVFDWILNFLDNRKCPYLLAVTIAKEVATQTSASYSAANIAEGDCKRTCSSADLYAEAINKLPAICSSFMDKENLDILPSSRYATSVFAIKNKRRKMEDRYLILHDLNTLLDFKDAPFQSYYAVFDGHSGIDAACYASAQLHLNIARHPDFFTDTPKAIIEGFQITDTNFLSKCNKENIKSGSTAVVALIRENTVYLSWLGDSQAVLVKEGTPVTLTKPHKPDREDERNRIESLGGLVASHMGTCRVNGLLAVSRAIGDPDQKEFITSEPEVIVLNLDGTEDFLILACDGLWDGMSPEDVSAVLYRYLKDNLPDEPYDAVAAKLVHQSKLQGSEDNITTIVIFLRDVKAIIENSSKFMTHSFSVQHHDFLTMNGNTRSNVESISDAHIAKPTILELNSASSKKLKNTANVLSSAGLESSSYGYQYVENLEDNFQGLDNLVANSSQNVFVSHQSIPASCFAPEATALSELPTPPIDDMLASQQYENFYSTDLYKEISGTHSVDVDTQAVDVNAVQRDTNPIESAPSPCSNIPFSHPSSMDEIAANIGSISLQDKNTDLGIKESSNNEISPNEAVEVASTVVSNAVETAVKCLASSEMDVASTVQSQLNPYAKPFVMKSFFEEPESKSESPKSDFESCVVTSNAVESLASKSESPKSNDFESCVVTSNAVESLESKSVSPKSNDFESCVVTSNAVESLIETPKSELIMDNTAHEENMISFSDTTAVKIMEEDYAASENKILEQVDNQTSRESVLLDQLVQDTNNDLASISNLPSAIESHILLETDPHSEILGMPQQLINISDEGAVKMENLSIVHEKDSLIQDKEFVSNANLSNEQNLSDKSFISNEGMVPISEKDQKFEIVSTSPQSIIACEFVNEQKSTIEIISNNALCSELSASEENQNLVLDNISVSASIDEDISKSKRESKNEIIEESIVTSVEKEISNIPDASLLLESITKDSLSLMNIQNELNVAEAEVPPDPTTEDTKIEAVAIDLKSLPEGIAEAEGVTEDIDSDSEKDGGWSYMKGNTVSGSKPKADEKTSKTHKSTEIKSTHSLKTKKDVIKPSIEPKTIKAKSVASDKMDKMKSTSVDKAKIITVTDKIKTIASIDKNKKSALEKKTDIKDKGRVLKTSATTTTTTSSATTTKVNIDKTNRITSATNVKKVTEMSSKITSTISKPSRPTTLARTNAPASKTTSSSLADKNVSDKVKSISNISTKPKLNAAASENKSGVKNATLPVLSKGQPSGPSKSGISTVRGVSSRPPTSTSTRTNTITKSVSLQKSALTESKSKPPTNTIRKLPPPPPPATTTTVTKRPDVKEVKDNVNKQISARKNMPASKVESSTSTLINKKVVSMNNKTTVTKVSSTISKQEFSKRDMPKHSTYRSTTKNAGSKSAGDIGKGKLAVSTTTKTEETKNTINIESDQKNVSEVVQISEEKFILETSDKEVTEKETCEMATEKHEILENGSLSDSVTPVQDKTPAAECAPENL